MRKYFLFTLFLCSLTISHSYTNNEGVVFYCRVCGQVIANYSSIIEKDADNVDSISELGNQNNGVQIQYDSFESSVKIIIYIDYSIESMERKETSVCICRE